MVFEPLVSLIYFAKKILSHRHNANIYFTIQGVKFNVFLKVALDLHALYCVACKYYVSTRVLFHTIISLGKQNWWCMRIQKWSEDLSEFSLRTDLRSFYLHLAQCTSMITVAEFRTKQATGSWYMLTDNYMPIIFSLKLIWIDCNGAWLL